MANVIIDDTYLTGIANAIRTKTGGSDTYTPAQMATAIGNLSVGGGGSGSIEWTDLAAKISREETWVPSDIKSSMNNKLCFVWQGDIRKYLWAEVHWSETSYFYRALAYDPKCLYKALKDGSTDVYIWMKYYHSGWPNTDTPGYAKASYGQKLYVSRSELLASYGAANNEWFYAFVYDGNNNNNLTTSNVSNPEFHGIYLSSGFPLSHDSTNDLS